MFARIPRARGTRFIGTVKISVAARRLQQSLVRAAAALQRPSDTGPLRGAVATAAEIVRATARGTVVDVATATTVEVPAPWCDAGGLPASLARPETLSFPATYATALPDVLLLEGEGYVIAGGRLVLDLSPQIGRDARDHAALLRWRRPPPVRLDAPALVLTGIDLRNHYHWLFDALPRHDIVARSGLRWRKVIAPSATSAQRACLARLRIDPAALVAPPWEGQYRMREALLGSFASLPEAPGPAAVDTLRRLFADCLRRDATLPARVFVSRRDAPRRRLVNDAAVRAFLESRGFAVLALETMTLDDQARAFANAEIVVAPHGAGLANLAFARPGTRIVELMSDGYPSPLFRRLAALVEAPYACVLDGRQRVPWGVRARDRDFQIDVGALARVI